MTATGFVSGDRMGRDGTVLSIPEVLFSETQGNTFFSCCIIYYYHKIIIDIINKRKSNE